MPRPLRIHVPGGFYHVTLRGNHQRAIFVDEGDQRLLNTIVARALENFTAKLHAYCWMSNHIHLLLEVGSVPLANPMRNIASEFARAMQRKLQTTGHFFERRYHASIVDVDAYFLELIRYIHLNPVRANMVDHPAKYVWSSHHVYVGGRGESWVTTDFALSLFGRTRATALTAYRAFLESPCAQEWEPSRCENLAELDSPTVALPFAKAPAVGKGSGALDELISEACLKFEINRASLESRVRDRYMSEVRTWIAIQALDRQVCGLTGVARALGRDESTLRESIRRRQSC